jgi:hypothetical protein
MVKINEKGRNLVRLEEAFAGGALGLERLRLRLERVCAIAALFAACRLRYDEGFE